MARSRKVESKKVKGRRGKGSAAPPLSLEPAMAPAEIPAAIPAEIPSAGPAAFPVAIDVTALASAPRIVLCDVLDQTAAGTLQAELLSHRGVDAVVDAAAVRRIGGQCLQVLLSAAATWTRDGAALAVVNTSPEFIAGVRLLGIDPGELASRKPFAGAA